MSPTRREVLAQFTAPLAILRIGWPTPASNPLAATIAQCQTARLRRYSSAVEVTTEALARCTRDFPRNEKCFCGSVGSRFARSHYGTHLRP